jgi:LPS sulfotransferase NodH
MIDTTLKEIRDLSYFHTKNLALNLGLLESHLDYCKFIILGTARSGTTFLRGLLNSHSEVVAFGELFRQSDIIGWDLFPQQKYLQHRSLKTLFQTHPDRFLEEAVFKKYPKRVSAVGFKIFYYQAQEEPQKKVWDSLRNNCDIKVIHLKRINALATFVSLKKAFTTNQWCNTTGRSETAPTISLDYDECLEYFTWVQESQQKYDDFFQAHLKLDVFYEELCQDDQKEMKIVQDFLGVNYELAKPSTYKQSSQSIAATVSNYFELKERFTGTAWQSFFED